MKVYWAGWNKYQTFASQFSISTAPITIEKVTLFIAFLGNQSLAGSTIESYIAALRFFRVLSDPSCLAPSFHTPYVNLLIRGIKRTNASRRSPHVRLPITVTLMRRIKQALSVNPHSYENVLLWAACCTGFFGFLRCAEFLTPDDTPFDPQVHLSLDDLAYRHTATPPHFEVQIKASKTDQFHQGTAIVLGATGVELCPVAALLDFLGKRGGSPGPVFINADATPMRRRQFVSKVQEALTVAGVNGGDFNGHSFRIGAATSASQAGIPETTIKTLGRWRSMAYQQYIRPSPPDLAAMSSQLASAAHKS